VGVGFFRDPEELEMAWCNDDVRASSIGALHLSSSTKPKFRNLGNAKEVDSVTGN